jgi:hypothetical protein
VGGVEEEYGVDLVGDLAELRNGVRVEVQARPDRDDLWSQVPGQDAHGVHVDGEFAGVNGCGDGGQAVHPGGAVGVMRDMASDAWW